MTNILILNMHIKNKTKVSIRIESNLIKKRTMFKQATNKLIQNISAKSNQTSGAMLREYATHRVFTPRPTTSSQDGLKNNPAVSLHRTKGDVVIQHPELVQQQCVQDNCKEFACQELCDEAKTEENSVGLLTHSNKKGGIVISDTDIDGVPSEQILRTFETPHKTTGESANEVRDQQRTENLQKMLIEVNDD